MFFILKNIINLFRGIPAEFQAIVAIFIFLIIFVCAKLILGNLHILGFILVAILSLIGIVFLVSLAIKRKLKSRAYCSFFISLIFISLVLTPTVRALEVQQLNGNDAPDTLEKLTSCENQIKEFSNVRFNAIEEKLQKVETILEDEQKQENLKPVDFFMPIILTQIIATLSIILIIRGLKI